MSVVDGKFPLVNGDKTIQAEDLWASKPVLILAIRRPGCVLCRAQAKRIKDRKADFEAAGVDVVVVVHEWVDREIKAFVPEYWDGPLWHDVDKGMYKLVQGGKLKKGSILSMLNPFGQAWRNIRQARQEVKDSNVAGDGMIFGGMLVVGKGGTSLKLFPEKDFGEYAPLEEVLDACKKA